MIKYLNKNPSSIFIVYLLPMTLTKLDQTRSWTILHPSFLQQEKVLHIAQRLACLRERPGERTMNSRVIRKKITYHVLRNHPHISLKIHVEINIEITFVIICLLRTKGVSAITNSALF